MRVSALIKMSWAQEVVMGLNWGMAGMVGVDTVGVMANWEHKDRSRGLRIFVSRRGKLTGSRDRFLNRVGLRIGLHNVTI